MSRGQVVCSRSPADVCWLWMIRETVRDALVFRDAGRGGVRRGGGLPVVSRLWLARIMDLGRFGAFHMVPVAGEDVAGAHGERTHRR